MVRSLYHYGSNDRKYIDLSQKIFAIDMLRALKSSLKHRRKHILRSLQLYGDQALGCDFITSLLFAQQTDLLSI